MNFSEGIIVFMLRRGAPKKVP